MEKVGYAFHNGPLEELNEKYRGFVVLLCRNVAHASGESTRWTTSHRRDDPTHAGGRAHKSSAWLLPVRSSCLRVAEPCVTARALRALGWGDTTDFCNCEQRLRKVMMESNN